MAGDGDIAEVAAYVSSSKYRVRVLEHLADADRATPTEIAESAGEPRPHVSRALSELRERDVVELLVPELRKVGRYYGLTATGERAWSELAGGRRDVEWSVEAPSGGAAEAVVELAREELGDWLRLVGLSDDDGVTILYADREAVPVGSEGEFDDEPGAGLLERSFAGSDVPGDDCWSEVVHFADVSVLRVRVDGESWVSISFANAGDVSVPAFADAVASVFETHASP